MRQSGNDHQNKHDNIFNLKRYGVLQCMTEWQKIIDADEGSKSCSVPRGIVSFLVFL